MTTSVKDNLHMRMHGYSQSRNCFPPWNIWLHVEWWPYCRPQKSSLI